VSPFAFFQVNQLVFEKMLKLINEFASIDAETTLFDICCGTGAIGLCLSQQNVKKVIGVELIEEAVINARKNVKLNEHKFEGKEIEFHAGKAEEILPKIVGE
jgi:23S rRNA (uracil1939-C5)-methyltransferase